jgi:hypothetical protein
LGLIAVGGRGLFGGGGVGGSESPIITTRQTQVATLSIENSRPWLALLHQVCAGLSRAPYHPPGGWRGGAKKKEGKKKNTRRKCKFPVMWKEERPRKSLLAAGEMVDLQGGDDSRGKGESLR